MKKMRKALAMILSLAMVLAMSATAFASGDTQDPAPDATGGSETNVATIKGVFVENPMPTITAYQIVKYNESGYYEVVEGLENWITTVEDPNSSHKKIELSSKNAQELYYNHLDIVKNGISAVFDAQTRTEEKDGEQVTVYTGEYTKADLGLGTWLVVVTSSSGKYLYNPAVISVSQTADGVQYGELNLDTETWMSEEGVYLKRDEPTIKKTAEPAERAENTPEQNADTNIVGTQYNDIIKYTIEADIPAYTPDRKNITYTITDTIKGLDYLVDEAHPVEVKIEGVEDSDQKTADEATVQTKAEAAMTSPETVTPPTTPATKKAVVTGLSDEFLVRNAGKKIVITYYAKVTSTVMINVDRLNNTASLDYSNNSDNEGDSGHSEDITKHYTFGIDASVTGNDASQDKTGEFIKINEKGDVDYKETLGEIEFKNDAKPLGKAQFELRIGSAAGPKFTDKSGKSTFETSDDGRLTIAGLDDGVEYFLVETKAPDGYTINTEAVRVYIDAKYVVDSTTGKQDLLQSYKVLIGGSAEDTSTAKVTNYNYNVLDGTTTLVNTPGTANNPYGFKNSTLAELPSTGGIGTTIFTIGGCIIMIVAAGLFFASRRKKAEN